MDPGVDLVLRGALALLFAAAAVHKARDLQAFRTVLADYHLLPAASVPAAALLLIAFEGCLAATLPLPLWRAATPWAAVALLSVYTGAIAVNLVRGRRHIDCGCGGPAHGQPLGPWLLARNALLIAAALGLTAPSAARELVAQDLVTVAGGISGLALLYAAANHLIAAWPAHSRLRRVH